MNPITKIINNSISYLKGSREELKKVTWPTRQEAIKYTIMVIGVSLAVAFFLGAFDLGLNMILQKII